MGSPSPTRTSESNKSNSKASFVTKNQFQLLANEEQSNSNVH